MKRVFLVFAMMAMNMGNMWAQTTWFNRDELDNGSSWSGICAEALKGSNTEDGFGYMSYGSKYKTIKMYAGHQIRLDAGYVNLDSVMVYMYSSTTYQAPLIASDGTELTYEQVTIEGLNYLQGKWKNPGTFVGVLTLTVGDKATLAANEANRDKKGEVAVIQVDVYASEEIGACGAPIPVDSLTMKNLTVSFTQVGDLELDHDFVIDATDTEAGCTIHYPFSMIWEDCADEWGDGDPHNYKLKTDATVKAGTETYAIEYGGMTVQKNSLDATQYDFHIDVIGANGTRYFMDWTGKMVASSALFAKEPMTPTTINFAPTEAIYDTWVSHHQIMIYLQKDDDFIQLDFVADKVTTGTIVALGTYAINDEGDKGTIRMSDGFQEGYENEGSAYYINPVEEEYGWNPETAYFFKSGTVKVESSAQGIKITVNATSHYGSTINAVYEGGMTDIDDLPTGIDQIIVPNGKEIVNGQSSSRKFFRDGQLFILRDGKTYNALGEEVR